MGLVEVNWHLVAVVAEIVLPATISLASIWLAEAMLSPLCELDPELASLDDQHAYFSRQPPVNSNGDARIAAHDATTRRQASALPRSLQFGDAPTVRVERGEP